MVKDLDKTIPLILTQGEIEVLEKDLITYLLEQNFKGSKEEFLEVFLAGTFVIKPLQPMIARYTTWRRREKPINLPWFELKHKVFVEKGLSFKKYNGKETVKTIETLKKLKK